MSGESETPVDVALTIVAGMGEGELCELVKRLVGLPNMTAKVLSEIYMGEEEEEEAKPKGKGKGRRWWPFWSKVPTGIDESKKGAYRIEGEWCGIMSLPEGTPVVVGLKGEVKEYAVGVKKSGMSSRPFLMAAHIEIEGFSPHARGEKVGHIEDTIRKLIA